VLSRILANLNMNIKIIFTVLFLFSLTGIQIASFEDWLILSLVIQVIWISIIANDIIKHSKSKSKLENIIVKFNKIFIKLLIADIVIIFLSMSFGFRIIFASLYIQTFYVSGICIIISIFGNYYIIINELIKRAYSLGKIITLILSSLIYPIGVYTVRTIKPDANNF
jgi:hypothetical protein